MSFNQLYYILNIINAPAAGSVEQLGIVGTKHFVPQEDQDSNWDILQIHLMMNWLLYSHFLKPSWKK